MAKEKEERDYSQWSEEEEAQGFAWRKVGGISIKFTSKDEDVATAMAKSGKFTNKQIAEAKKKFDGAKTKKDSTKEVVKKSDPKDDKKEYDVDNDNKDYEKKVAKQFREMNPNWEKGEYAEEDVLDVADRLDITTDQAKEFLGVSKKEYEITAYNETSNKRETVYSSDNLVDTTYQSKGYEKPLVYDKDGKLVDTDMIMELHGYVEANPTKIKNDISKAIKDNTVDEYLRSKALMSDDEISSFKEKYNLNSKEEIEEEPTRMTQDDWELARPNETKMFNAIDNGELDEKEVQEMALKYNSTDTILDNMRTLDYDMDKYTDGDSIWSNDSDLTDEDYDAIGKEVLAGMSDDDIKDMLISNGYDNLFTEDEEISFNKRDLEDAIKELNDAGSDFTWDINNVDDDGEANLSVGAFGDEYMSRDLDFNFNGKNFDEIKEQLKEWNESHSDVNSFYDDISPMSEYSTTNSTGLTDLQYNSLDDDEKDILEGFTSDYGYDIDDEHDALDNLVSQIDYMKYGNKSVRELAKEYASGGSGTMLIASSDMEDYLKARGIKFKEGEEFEKYTDDVSRKIERLYNLRKKGN